NELVFKSEKSMVYDKWPEYDEAKTKDDMVTIVIQVNGKIRDKIEVSADISKEELEKLVLNNEKVKAFLTTPVKKVIVVPKKLVSIVC
ncbi:MAG: leucine--tRNA ligase, partial [Bacilli bacterium]|nr:leucine--tRNA ligase [Bacilli bacterium]